MFHLNKIIIGLLAIFALGCNITDKEQGDLKISIPSLSAPAQNLLTKEASKNTRAFMFIDKVILTVYQGENFVSEKVVEINDNGDIEAFIVLDEGTYTLQAEVFNLNSSKTDSVTSGVSADFTIIAGSTTDVNIVLKPSNPVILGEDTVFTLDSFVLSDFEDEMRGSEHWFQITPSSNVTTLSINKNSYEYNSSVVYVYDIDGHVITYEKNYGNIVFDTAHNDVYYVVLLPQYKKSYGMDIISSVEFSYFATELTDNNNSMSTSTAVITDNSIVFNEIAGESDLDYYNIDTTVGNIYTIANKSNMTYMRLLDSVGNIIIESDFKSKYHYVAKTSETLYIEISKSEYTQTSFSYAFTIEENTFTPLSVSSSWNELDIEYKESSLYVFDVAIGSSYNIICDDQYGVTGVYTSDVWVSVTDNLGFTYFEEKDSSYNEVLVIVPSEGVTTVTIEINGFWDGGTLGLLVEEVIE